MNTTVTHTGTSVHTKAHRASEVFKITGEVTCCWLMTQKGDAEGPTQGTTKGDSAEWWLCHMLCLPQEAET